MLDSLWQCAGPVSIASICVQTLAFDKGLLAQLVEPIDVGLLHHLTRHFIAELRLDILDTYRHKVAAL